MRFFHLPSGSFNDPSAGQLNILSLVIHCQNGNSFELTNILVTYD